MQQSTCLCVVRVDSVVSNCCLCVELGRSLVSYSLFLQQKLLWISIAPKTQLEIDSLKLNAVKRLHLMFLLFCVWNPDLFLLSAASLIVRKRDQKYLFFISQYNWCLLLCLHFSSQFYRGNWWSHLIFKLPTFIFCYGLQWLYLILLDAAYSPSALATTNVPHGWNI